MRFRNLATATVLAISAFTAIQANAWVQQAATAARKALSASTIQQVPATGVIEVGFSPNKGAEDLVLKVIRSAKSDIKVMAYAFTSANVARALLASAHNGVRVSIIADEKSTTSSRQAQSALSALATAGANVRTISVFPIHHDKVIIVDGQHVELGSFNYSAAAATKNSENVLVNWSNPALAKVYGSHFSDNWALSQQFKPNY